MQGSKTKTSILDIFSQIRNEKDASNPDLFVTLWKHLSSTAEAGKVDANGVSMEIRYCLERLIRGLGSSRAPIRKSYFASLVSILRKCDSASCSITLNYFKELVDAQLSKFESKGEEGEVLSGRILAYGIAMRSKIFMNGTVELQQAIISEMLKKSTERSYLPLLSYTFIIDFIKTIDGDVFKTLVWPLIMNEVMVSWPSQSFETLYCLLEIQEKHPKSLKKKQILTTFGTSSILHAETIENIQRLLMNITWEPCLKHPLYEIIGKRLSRHEYNYEILDKLWSHVEEALNNSPTRLKILAAFTIFDVILRHIQLEKIPDLLTPSLVENVFNACRSSVNKTDELSVMGRRMLESVITRIMDEEKAASSAVVYKILSKLIFESKQILIDKVTGVKVMFNCVAKLDEEHVKLLAKKCEDIILLKSSPEEEKNGVQHRWNHKDRCYATQLLARLISHLRIKDVDWKKEHLQLMMQHALFLTKMEDGSHISDELATTLKNSFFTALSHQLSHLKNLKTEETEETDSSDQLPHLEKYRKKILSPLVFYIHDNIEAPKYELRTKLSKKNSVLWRKIISKIKEIDKKIKKSTKKMTIMHIFNTLFLQMALHFFVDPVVAENVFEELNRCDEEEKAMPNKYDHDNIDDSAESSWIVMTIELFLKLLSQDTYLLRRLIARIFPHLCQHLTAQATFQILQVFDPSSNEAILTEDDGNSDYENGPGENEEEEIDGDSSSDSDIEDVDDVEETAIERTRQAVRDALEMAGNVTDTESIDLDDIDEEDGRKLDLALALAFKNVQKSQSSKNRTQSTADKALMNFRTRVLDLVDIYLDHKPALSLVLDTIPVLFKLLEFTLKDSHQKPLENRTRSTIKKIGHLKKCGNVEEVEENILVGSLKSLTDKGIRSSPLFLGLCNELSECCTFLVRMHIQLTNNRNNQVVSLFYENVNASLENFFLKRDCLLPISLFENILLKTTWIFNLTLCKRILELSFDTKVRGYRRNQGLSLLNCFYQNARLLSSLKITSAKELTALECEILVNAAQTLKPNAEVSGNSKQTFVSELLSLLYNMKRSKVCAESSEWIKLSDSVRSFFTNTGVSASSIPRKYAVRLCSVLRIDWKILQYELSSKIENAEIEENCAGFVDGLAVGHSNDLHNDGDNGSKSDIEIDSENWMLNANTIARKKKKKRKNNTQECKNAKRLRSEITNDVEVIRFSETNLVKPF